MTLYLKIHPVLSDLNLEKVGKIKGMRLEFPKILTDVFKFSDSFKDWKDKQQDLELFINEIQFQNTVIHKLKNEINTNLIEITPSEYQDMVHKVNDEDIKNYSKLYPESFVKILNNFENLTEIDENSDKFLDEIPIWNNIFAKNLKDIMKENQIYLVSACRIVILK